MNPKLTHLKRATTLSVIVALVLCQSYVTGTPLAQVVSKIRNYVVGTNNAVPRAGVTKLPNVAQLTAAGAVTLNGLNAPNGATVFSGSGVKTTETSTAILSLGTMAQVELGQASDFTLAVEGKTLGGQLRAGRANIVAPAGVAVKIVTADGPVVADGREATNLAVDVTSGKTIVELRHNLANAITNADIESQVNEQQDGRSRTVSLSPQEALEMAKARLEKAKKAQESVERTQSEASKQKDVVKLNCINDKLAQLKTLVNTLEGRVKDLGEANAEDTVAIKNIQTVIEKASGKIDNLLSEAQQCIGQSNFVEGATITAIIVSVFSTAAELLNDPPGESDLSPIQPF